MSLPKIYQDVNLTAPYKKNDQKRRHYKKFMIVGILLIALILLSLFFLKASFTISQINQVEEIKNNQVSKKILELPKKDEDYLNILLLGMRGAADEGDGKLLTDAIIVLSFKKSTKQIVLISIPRDLYTDVYCSADPHRINIAYVQGGLDCVKKTIAWMTNMYIDYAVASNFKAFTEVIDALGGLDVYVDKSLYEDKQWTLEGWSDSPFWSILDVSGQQAWVFQVATGTNHFDGRTALYYVRSRFSSSDFERIQRQQKIIMSLKDKISSLGILGNPVKIYQLMDIAGNNIRTDMPMTEIASLINQLSKFDISQIKHLGFDTSPSGLLYETFINQEYVLLPVGDNFEQLRSACRNIFNQ